MIQVSLALRCSSIRDATRDEVVEYSGMTIQELVEAGSRGAAVEKMRDCIQVYVKKLYEEGTIQGLIAIGGAEGSVIARAAMDGTAAGRFPRLPFRQLRPANTCSAT